LKALAKTAETADVYVNGRLAMRISKLGWLLRMDPIIEPWAAA